ncbi:MAG: hypothetical protein VR65_07035 [Desulfobulbaceae bacterium BRH_c16a]|nr:MAG: hypothetical protein VR65_07035 [Desulfobulbaceae bacterium BRH_c16a]
MTLIFDSGRGIAPSTHVLAIGVGRYPHLLGGDKKLADKPMGLGQLDSPSVSLKALLDWFLAPVMLPGSVGFTNQAAPLGTIHSLASAPQPVNIDTPTGTVTLDCATKDNIDNAFTSWLNVVKGSDTNIGVFYFCGHGVMVSDHYLLAEDFGSTLQAWTKAFDVSSTIRAVEREVNGALYFFLDACREVSRDLALSVGANPMALMQADLTKKVIRKASVCISATGEGELAFAPPGGEVSRFSKALLRALSGFSGIKSAGQPVWEVDGETLASAIRKILEYEWEKTQSQKGNRLQVCGQLINGSSVPLLRLLTTPKVAVEINYLPEVMRTQYELYIQSTQAKVAQIRENKCLETEVPMGVYTVGAVDPNGVHQSDIRPDEDLRPPCYNLELGGQA